MATSPSKIAFSQVLWKQANGKQRGKPHFYEETHRNVTSTLNPAENPNRGVLLPVSVTTKFQFQLSEKQFFSQSLSKTITVWVWWTHRCYSMLIPALPLILFEPVPWRCPLWGVSSQWRQQRALLSKVQTQVPSNHCLWRNLCLPMPCNHWPPPWCGAAS